MNSKCSYFSKSLTNPAAIEIIKYSGTREMWDALTKDANWDEFSAEIICNYKYV
jgi:hypothetical protein